jgi:hypothetical protein
MELVKATCVYFVGVVKEPETATCSRALQALRSVRQHFTKDSKQEQKNNFAPYSIKKLSQKKKGRKGPLRACTFKMVCLSSPQDDRVPCTAASKEVLIEAGLGAKSVTIPDSSCSREEFWKVITSAYPKLLGCGGFEFLRCVPNSRELDMVSQNASQSPKLLKAIVGNGRVFIRPLQKDLSLDRVPSQSSFACVSVINVAWLSLVALLMLVNEGEMLVL